MNILLVNYSLKSNYGGILQSYALQEVLKSLGHNVVKVELIPDPKKVFTIDNIILFLKRLVLKFVLFEKDIDLFAEYHEAKAEVLIQKNARRFINQYLNVIYVNNLSELNSADFQAIIVGSDQVWRKSGSDRLLSEFSASDNAFLSFAETWNCRRVAYAVSLGLDYWEYNKEETKILSNLIKKFDAISVREDSAIELLKTNLCTTINIEHLLDPTLLLDRCIYDQLVTGFNCTENNGNLLIYILDESSLSNNCITELENRFKLKGFHVNNPKSSNPLALPKERIQPPIEQWLNGFANAEMIITDSFHACVFSLIYEKPFWVLANELRGTSRIYSLLKLFNLENRIVTSVENISNIKNDIPWDRINEIKGILQLKSLEFIKKSLSVC